MHRPRPVVTSVCSAPDDDRGADDLIASAASDTASCRASVHFMFLTGADSDILGMSGRNAPRRTRRRGLATGEGHRRYRRGRPGGRSTTAATQVGGKSGT